METAPGDRDKGATRYLPLCPFCQEVWSLPTFSFCHSHLLINAPTGHELRKRSRQSCVHAGHPKATHFFPHALCHFYVPATLQDLYTHIMDFLAIPILFCLDIHVCVGEYVYQYVRATSKKKSKTRESVHAFLGGCELNLNQASKIENSHYRQWM